MKQIVELAKTRKAEFDGYKEKATRADVLVAEIEKEKGKLSPSALSAFDEYKKPSKKNKSEG